MPSVFDMSIRVNGKLQLASFDYYQKISFYNLSKLFSLCSCAKLNAYKNILT